jgi:hypothetical protein
MYCTFFFQQTLFYITDKNWREILGYMNSIVQRLSYEVMAYLRWGIVVDSPWRLGFFDMTEFLTPVPLSLVTCKLALPIVGLKTVSYFIFALKQPNKNLTSYTLNIAAT